MKIRYSDLTQTHKDLACKLSKEGTSRRQMMKLSLMTGVSLVAAKHLLLDAKVAMAADPKKGGTIRFASNIHGPDDNQDPQLFTSNIDYTRGRAVYNGLVQIGEGIKPMPELATEWTPNADASEWTFTIRKGVKFHDGSDLTAEDVVYSMNRHLAEKSTSVVKSVMSSVKEWTKSGPLEVKATLNGPNADLPILLGLYQNKVIKADSTGGFNGTGPFTSESFEPGVKSVHKRNENYWREGAHLDAIEMTAITDPVARVNALISGDIQIASSLDAKAFRQIEAADNVDLLSVPAALQLGICCLKNTAPGDNADFVKGMQFLQDRERIVKRILKGKGSLGNDTPISAAHGENFCSELPQREFDLDKAKFHFKKAGISGAELFVAPITAGIEDIALLSQANAAKIGFDLKLKKVPNDGYWGAVWMKEPVNMVNWNMRPTANSQLAIQFAPGAKWNDTFWENKRMGELLKSSLSELDPDKRHEMYCEMQTLVHNESGMVIPAFSNVNDGIAKNVMGIPKIPLGQVGGAEWPEFAWLA